MSFASDKLYRGYLRRSMPTIVSRVKVREILPHLPCLTDHDRETIEAKRETCGNYDGMMLLLDCLKRRESWAEQFIEALEACDHPTLAAEIRAEYNALKGTNDSNPSSPSAAVTRAHVHAAPSASHQSVPESGGNGEAAVAPPADVSVPAEPAAEPSPALEIPVQPQAPPSLAAAAPPAVDVPEIVPPPEAVAEPPQAAPAPSTPPPSPETVHAPATETPPPQGGVNAHQEMVEDSESDDQGMSGDDGEVLDQESAGNGEVSLDSADAPGAPGPVKQCETNTPSSPDPQQTAATTEQRPPRTPSPTQIDSDATDGSSFLETPERTPVQDTTPPVDTRPAAVQQPEETSDISDTPTTQVVKSSQQTEAAATAAPPPAAAAAAAASPTLLDDVGLSKPGELVSIQTQNHSGSTVRPGSPVHPFSGNSDLLQISEPVTSAHFPACSAPAVESTVTAPPCQENGVALGLNEPEENQYDSFEVHVSVGHISEQPSILDMDGQSLTPPAPTVNGEAAKEITSPPPPLSTTTTAATDTVSNVNPPVSENHLPPSEPAPADISPEQKPQQDSDEKTCPHKLPANTKYILTAAGVGACALLMAWKFKN